VSIQSPVDAYDVAQSSKSNSGSIGGSASFWRAKRVVDVFVSLLLLPALAFFALALLLLNLKFNRGPLFFHQKRMGQDLVPFTAIKFRSMQPVGTITRAVEDPIEIHRITALGRVMRKTRIDELPQILNVLRGEMSLIGPRPDFYDHAREYVAQIPEYRHRHLVRPGISGLAQVTLGYAEGLDATRAKATADLAYIRNASFGLELRIFWLTLVTVFMRRGA
jgi:lipopolysaccharide/colanic/teichoic acid biosynthesis glycosyltransferase